VVERLAWQEVGAELETERAYVEQTKDEIGNEAVYDRSRQTRGDGIRIDGAPIGLEQHPRRQDRSDFSNQPIDFQHRFKPFRTLPQGWTPNSERTQRDLPPAPTDRHFSSVTGDSSVSPLGVSVSTAACSSALFAGSKATNSLAT